MDGYSCDVSVLHIDLALKISLLELIINNIPSTKFLLWFGHKWKGFLYIIYHRTVLSLNAILCVSSALMPERDRRHSFLALFAATVLLCVIIFFGIFFMVLYYYNLFLSTKAGGTWSFDFLQKSRMMWYTSSFSWESPHSLNQKAWLDIKWLKLMQTKPCDV